MENQKDKIKLIQQLLASAKSSIHSAEQMLKSISGTSTDAVHQAKEKARDLSSSVDGKVVEGVFNGLSMIGPEDKEYRVPENYASKSKLVQGDVLKLTIAEDGGFLFKQIGPVPRKNLVGELVEENGAYKAIVDGKTYKMLTASVTYHKAGDGDQVTIIIPEKEDSEWAALENVVSSGGVSSPEIVEVSEEVPEPVQKDIEQDPEVSVPVENAQAELAEKVERVSAENESTELEKKEPPKEPEKPGEGVKELEI